MDSYYVSDRVWKDHYYVCNDWRNKPSRSRINVQNKTSYAQVGVMEAAYYDRSPCDDGAIWIATELYVFFKAAEYADPYVTYKFYFDEKDRDLSYSKKFDLIKRTKIEVSKDGTITIAPYNGESAIYKLPVPNRKRCIVYSDEKWAEACCSVESSDE